MDGEDLLNERLLKSEEPDEEPHLEDYSCVTPDNRQRPAHRDPRLIAIIVLSLLSSVSLLANAMFWTSSRQGHEDAVCSAYTSQYHPPLLDSAKMAYRTIAFNGTFAKQNIYRQNPSPEVDEAWRALGTDYRPLIIQEGEEAVKAGLVGRLKRSPELGGGYPVQVEGLHHLHCLDLLRQSLYWNYEYYNDKGTGAFENEDGPFRSHVGHCLDILRQQLMCTADFNVFGQVYIEGINSSFPDFMTKHKCKDFEAIRQWAHDGQVSEEQLQDGRMLVRTAEDWVLLEIP